MRWPLELLIAGAAIASLSIAFAQERVPAPVESVPETARPEEESRLLTTGRLLRDEARIWSFPVRAHEHAATIFAVTSGTIGLVVLDPHIAPYFGRPQFDRFKNGILTKRPMAAMIVGIPAVTYAAGLLT